MNQKIKKAAVLGAGVMGSAIAAHLANVGIPSFLLDIVPPEMTEAEKKKRLTFESPEVRNRFAVQGKNRIQESRPASLYLKDDAELISVGNFEDHLSWVAQADWIIEVVIEDLKTKRELFRKLVPFLPRPQWSSSTPSAVTPDRSRCSSPQSTTHFTERKTASQLALNISAVVFQDMSLAQRARKIM